MLLAAKISHQSIVAKFIPDYEASDQKLATPAPSIQCDKILLSMVHAAICNTFISIDLFLIIFIIYSLSTKLCVMCIHKILWKRFRETIEYWKDYKKTRYILHNSGSSAMLLCGSFQYNCCGERNRTKIDISSYSRMCVDIRYISSSVWSVWRNLMPGAWRAGYN